MPDLETTQSKLRSTPTAGVSGEHSAYYRRLLSAGYKGYIQGSIGGGALYGTIGAGIGTLAGLALAVPTAGASLWLIPALGASFGLYGAHTFADIGKTAAIIADSADTNEKRRYLLDRYYETPSDEEAKEIKRQLEDDQSAKNPETPFHWRPALIGALVGIGLALAALAIPAAGLHIGGLLFLETLHIAPVVMLGTGAAIGALAGSVIGIDREYIRRWMDKAEFTVHEPSRAEMEIAKRERDVQRLAEAARRDTPDHMLQAPSPVEKIQVSSPTPREPSLERRPDPISPQQIAGLDKKPSASVKNVQHADRLEMVEQLAQNGL